MLYMRNLDISKIPEKYVRFWWLSKIINKFEHLIISPGQIGIFGSGGQYWDTYRDHLILVKNKKGIRTVRNYFRPKGELRNTWIEAQ